MDTDVTLPLKRLTTESVRFTWMEVGQGTFNEM